MIALYFLPLTLTLKLIATFKKYIRPDKKQQRHAPSPFPPSAFCASLDLLDPDERVVKFRVDGLQVFQSQRFVQNAFVEGQRETRVDEFAVEQGLRGRGGGEREGYHGEPAYGSKAS